MLEDTHPPFFNFYNADCQKWLMWVINLIGWITVPFVNATFAMSLTFFLHSSIPSNYDYAVSFGTPVYRYLGYRRCSGRSQVKFCCLIVLENIYLLHSLYAVVKSICPLPDFLIFAYLSHLHVSDHETHFNIRQR